MIRHYKLRGWVTNKIQDKTASNQAIDTKTSSRHTQSVASSTVVEMSWGRAYKLSASWTLVYILVFLILTVCLNLTTDIVTFFAGLWLSAVVEAIVRKFEAGGANGTYSNQDMLVLLLTGGFMFAIFMLAAYLSGSDPHSKSFQSQLGTIYSLKLGTVTDIGLSYDEPSWLRMLGNWLTTALSIPFAICMTGCIIMRAVVYKKAVKTRIPVTLKEKA